MSDNENVDENLCELAMRILSSTKQIQSLAKLLAIHPNGRCRILEKIKTFFEFNIFGQF